MASTDGKYNIKAIAKMLDLQPGTLRAWERRYQFIEPKRNQAGHRLYSEEHVLILKWLINKVNHGFPIGQAIDLLKKEQEPTSKLNVSTNEDYTVQLAEELLCALLSFNENQAQQLLNKAFSLFSFEKVSIEILEALLIKVAALWEEAQITKAHEHFVSTFIRVKIGQIYQGLPVNSFLPKVLLVCGPDETNDLQLLSFSLFLRRKGFSVLYLGEGIPAEDVELVLNETDASIFITSCTHEKNVAKTQKLLLTLEEKKRALTIGVVGAAFLQLQDKKWTRFLIEQNFEARDSWIKKIITDN
ncbi:MerR family transcriptional regulator [Alkalihalobacillus alcalophilus ATCC 27647 = CGMCC 1.3604]|uniref:MerR family transcriptional regulator n=1 Tax=Alkalihalobacillus alcalophilus ATCC 27647 = CGMCC 1.3604 TaxID=1218173 RepID=A0A094Z033_ALKAL|nr:MerR family transcriptional regulator [Alkalihalobacillus alcalophilus]KGA99177.1 MerR family transcriptional regulator [Alkalihalobacillus alcalophilus ATCC 27647 = CGMCC 1.3604]MED1561280.1 MerR family transcriptional regulator [Alkalihalobacillus alcalophilus]THG90091.1 MerR family transcriptional regulator [Alkalihalobacillus alcalophilus ATCC 27647 = CGMCC 1.3604]